MYIYIYTYVDAWVYHITTFQFQSAISETTTVQCKGRLMFCETGIKVQTVHLYLKKKTKQICKNQGFRTSSKIIQV